MLFIFLIDLSSDCYSIAQRAIRRTVLDALNRWMLDVIVSIAVMCPTVTCYVLNIKEKAAASQFNSVDR